MKTLLGYAAWLLVVLLVPFWLIGNPVLAGVVAVLGAATLVAVAGVHLLAFSLRRLAASR